MSIYTLGQTYDDLLWFHPSAMTLIAGMPVTVRGAGKFSVSVTDPEVLAQSVSNPAEIERVRSVLTTAFGEVVENITVSHKSQILALKGQLEAELRQKAEPKFNALGLHIIKLTLEQLQPV